MPNHTVGPALAQGAQDARAAAFQHLAAAIAMRNGIFRFPLDSLGNDRSVSLVNRIAQQLTAMGDVYRIYGSLRDQGLLPKGATMPQVDFPARTIPGAAAWETGTRGLDSPAVHFPPSTTEDIAFNPASQQVILHELAHAWQRPGVLGNQPYDDGGAQAYANAVAPQVIGPVPNSTGYQDYINQVQSRMGMPWVMQGQFGTRRFGRSLPPVAAVATTDPAIG